MKVEAIWGCGTNPHYDPAHANNGGGYWQYAGGITFAVGDATAVCEVEDTSVGDFGRRQQAVVEIANRKYFCGINEVDSRLGEEWDEESDSDRESLWSDYGIDLFEVAATAFSAANAVARRSEI